MPAQILEDPLRLSCTFSRGTSSVLRVEDALNPELTRELMTGLVYLMYPHGKGDSHRTAAGYKGTIDWFVRTLAEHGHCGGAAGLTRAMLVELWWSADNRRESNSRRLLAALDAETGALAPDVRALVGGRLYNKTPVFKPLVPYDEVAWQNLADTCRRIIEKSWADHRLARAAAETGRDPYEHGWTRENICWQLVHHGPATLEELGARVGWTKYQARRRIQPIHLLRQDLFPGLRVMLAYQLLFGVYTGIVPDGIDDLGVEDLEWAGQATILLSYVKGRTSNETLTLSKKAVRLLERWLEHSALLRAHCPPELRGGLWLRFESPGSGTNPLGPWQSGRAHRSTVSQWATVNRVVDAHGAVINLHRQVIRTTFESHRDRASWFGSRRATIDPNHTPAIEGDRYLSAMTEAQRNAVEEIVEQAQGDLLRKSRPAMVLSEEEVAQLADRFPQLVAELELDEAAIAELVGGQRDVFVASCADPLAGVHGPKGKPCPARPWVCLLCPLALFTPAHAVNLLRMKAFFARQWQQMPSAQFMAVFGHYARRIDEVLARYDPARLALAAAEVASTDDEIPLLPEESTR
ncbi:hypothetical protein [Embleya sp. NPDC020630]|uniref:hypothetical protein n=1 Tax=Embleya sp. NPDC020630 TaxID=3363979 RepID=UPI0037A8B507